MLQSDLVSTFIISPSLLLSDQLRLSDQSTRLNPALSYTYHQLRHGIGSNTSAAVALDSNVPHQPYPPNKYAPQPQPTSSHPPHPLLPPKHPPSSLPSPSTPDYTFLLNPPCPPPPAPSHPLAKLNLFHKLDRISWWHIRRSDMFRYSLLGLRL